MKRTMLRLLAVTLIFVLVACEGGTSGSVTGASSSCRQGGGRGTCEGRFRTLRGSYGLDIEDETIRSDDAIQVRVDAAVESGQVTVSVETPGGERVGATAGPGQPATLIALAAGDWEELEVRFEALDGEASGVSYTIVYELQ